MGGDIHDVKIVSRVQQQNDIFNVILTYKIMYTC